MSRSNFVYNHFLAILPDAATAERIVQARKELCDRHQLRGSLRPAHVFHVSLHPVHDGGEIPLEISHAVSSACDAVAAITSPFEIIFEQAVCFPENSRAMVLKGDKKRHAELTALHRALGLELRRNGLPASLSTNHHLTLLYGDQELQEPIEPVQWKAHEFVLVRSHVGATHYDILERWKLKGRPGSVPVSAETKPRAYAVQNEFRLE